MAKNTGTLVGAPIRPNDSADQYAAAYQAEIKGGHHSRKTLTERNGIGQWLREAGMTCYVKANGNTYKLENDLVTWTLIATPSGSSTNPGSGGNSATVQLISGNFGQWTSLDYKSASMINENFELRYKADLQAFPSRAIVYLQGQFCLAEDFAGTEITLGIITDEHSRPANELRQWMMVLATEIYLVIYPNGHVLLQSKDGLNLPTVGDDNGANPYYISTFYQPYIENVEPTVYTAHREGMFTRSNCGNGYEGSAVPYSHDYTSTIDQATADQIADDNFASDGQNYANDPGNGATCTVIPPVNNDVALTGNCVIDQNQNYVVSLNLTAPLTQDLQVTFHTAYDADGSGPFNAGPGGSIIIPAGQTFAEATLQNPVFGGGGVDQTTPVVVDIFLVSPNPTADGKTITY